MGINAKQMISQKYLTRDEAAQLLRADKTTIDRYARTGKFTKYGIGRKVLFLKDEVERALIQL